MKFWFDKLCIIAIALYFMVIHAIKSEGSINLMLVSSIVWFIVAVYEIVSLIHKKKAQ